ncbi:hypothetical protein PLEOSDRAFT_1102161 [Pleurotus ostreatus PC15]|uniref:Uncharacterized protein n=1 Tax=Pleurotus ostreatus (strain PC15) TaxID=1137138 RepID=A0A067NVZ4_PLEO1|nr:hypothetical protein PLEOSDRAFT_1102161 [Pleurotus ostreatus PC15]
MGCFPSKQDDGRALARSSRGPISHQTQIPIQSLHDADTESVVFTAGRPSFGFTTMPHSATIAAAPPRKSLGAQPGKTRPMLPAHLQLNPNPPSSPTGFGQMQQIDLNGRPSLSRTRSFGPTPASAGATMGAGAKPKVSFAAQMLLKEREREMMWESNGASGGAAPPMTAPPTRETFGR